MVDDHAGLAQREGREHAHCVQRDQGVGETAEGDDEYGGRPGEEDDAIGEHQPVAPVGELPRQIAVAGDDRRQPRKVRIGRVGGEGQDGRRRELQDPVDGAAAVDGPPHLGDHRLVVARIRVEVMGEHRHAE